MPVEFEEVPSTKVEKVGQSIHPLPGPVPSGDLTGRPEEWLQRHEPGAAAARHAGASTSEKWLHGLGRGIFGGYFLYNGINHFQNGQVLTEYARAKGVPLPGVAVAVSGAMLVAGGVSLLIGARPKLGASLISAFLVGVSPQIHNFWTLDDPEQKMQEFTHFTKNLALIGGACFVAAASEPWPFSLTLGPRASSAA